MKLDLPYFMVEILKNKAEKREIADSIDISKAYVLLQELKAATTLYIQTLGQKDYEIYLNNRGAQPDGRAIAWLEKALVK